MLPLLLGQSLVAGEYDCKVDCEEAEEVLDVEEGAIELVVAVLDWVAELVELAGAEVAVLF